MLDGATFEDIAVREGCTKRHVSKTILLAFLAPESLIATQNAHYGSLIRARYGEPFFTHETMEVDDVVKLSVRSI